MRLVIAIVLLSACMEPRINPNDPKWVYNEFGEKWKGDKGDSGRDGIKGDKGERGEKGETGERGEKGEKGDKGDIGIQGIAGERGPQGLHGERGFIGPVGPQGIQGVEGPIGPQGPQGIQGEKGEKGDVGICNSRVIRTTAIFPQSPPVSDQCNERNGGVIAGKCIAQKIFVSVPELTADIVENGYVLVFFRKTGTTIWQQRVLINTIYSNTTIHWDYRCQNGSRVTLISTNFFSHTSQNTNEVGRYGPLEFSTEIVEDGIFVSVRDTSNNNSPCSPATEFDFKIVIVR